MYENHAALFFISYLFFKLCQVEGLESLHSVASLIVRVAGQAMVTVVHPQGFRQTQLVVAGLLQHLLDQYTCTRQSINSGVLSFPSDCCSLNLTYYCAQLSLVFHGSNVPQAMMETNKIP